jgi:hypothetical protein
MRRFAVAAVLLLIAPMAFGSGWKKAYFGATKPGSWVKYADSDSSTAGSTSTMTRMADDNGQARIEIRTEFVNGQYPPMVNQYTLRRGFVLDRDLIDYGSGVAAAASGTAADTVQPLDAATVGIIAKSMPQYGPTAAFKATETVDGKSCDRYGYSIHFPGNPATVETGDVWLSDSVPFGVVRMVSTTRDVSGKLTSKNERKLIASGSKNAATSSAAVAVSQNETHALKAAFDGGLIEINAQVLPGSSKGERVHLLVASKEKSFTLTVPKGRTSLHVGSPLGDFVFEAAAEQSFRLDADHSAELTVAQVGSRRALEGHFQISVYEGTPLWSGSATIGPVK